MIKKLTLDIKTSIDLYNDCVDLIEPSMCYNNVCNIMANKLKPQFQAGFVKIGYAYVGGENYRFVRHCVIITYDNRVIDVSAVMSNDIDVLNMLQCEDVVYYVFAELDLNEYLYMLKSNDYIPELRGSFLKSELEIIKTIENNHLEVVKDDYDKFIQEYNKLNV